MRLFMNACSGGLGFRDVLLMKLAMLSRLFRISILLIMLALASGGQRIIYRNSSQNIALTPLKLDPDRPNLRKVGQLEFLAAWELASNNQDFGGISALAVLPDGRFIGVSDAGTLVGFGLTGEDKTDRPFIAPMPDAFAKGNNYEDRDSEGITHDPATGRFWVSYEGKHAIRRFGRSFARREALARPKAMQLWGANSGAEAILRMPDGRFLVFSEGHDLPDDSYEALYFSGDPVEAGSSSFAFGYKPPEGHKITDAALLPDGRILTLNREFSFPTAFSVAVAVFDPNEIARGETIEPKVIARLKSPLLVDNLEGLAVTQENGRTIIWMISDNNFNIFQRTLLMKFALDETSIPDAKKPEADNAPGFEAL